MMTKKKETPFLHDSSLVNKHSIDYWIVNHMYYKPEKPQKVQLASLILVLTNSDIKARLQT
jgi:hypothetical protein